MGFYQLYKGLEQAVKSNRGAIVAAFPNTHSLFLAGGNEYVNINPVQAAISTTTQGAWEMRVRPVDATPAATSVIIGFSDTSANTRLQLAMMTSGKLRIFFAIAGVVEINLETDVSVFSDGVWATIGVSQNSTNAILYFNGIAVAQTETGGGIGLWINAAAGIDNGRLGDESFNSTGENLHANIQLDEVRIWNVAKSAAQFLDSHNGGCPKAVDEVGLVSVFKFDGDTVPVCRDNFGGLNSTYVNVVQNEIQEVTPC